MNSSASRREFDEWMRGTPDQAAALMVPYAGAIEAWEIGAEVGNVKQPAMLTTSAWRRAAI
jgi:putative SOS response-associated peptidase YedK